MLIASKSNGDTLTASEFNQITTELQTNLIAKTNQTPASGTLDQVGVAVASIAAQGGVFGVDSGVADAYVFTQVSPFPAPKQLTNGLTIRFRAGNANTGATTVNAFGFGAQSVKKADGSTDLSADDITTTQDTMLRYDGTNFRLVNNLNAGTAITVTGQTVSANIATQSDQETATSTTTLVTPGRQQYHPSAAKAWSYTTYSGGVPSSVAGYNIASVGDTGTGLLTLNFTVSFSSSNYAAISGLAQANTAGTRSQSNATGSVQIEIFDLAGVARDYNNTTVCFGDQ